jgi:hypothetical protein
MNHRVVRTPRRRHFVNSFIIDAVASLHSEAVLSDTFPLNHRLVRTPWRRNFVNSFIIDAVASLHSGAVLTDTFPLTCSAQLAA